jgi:Family of unknown function (DUF5941)
MTVALVLAAQPDAGLRGQLAALGVRRVDAAEQAGASLLTVAAAAQAADERVLICVGDDSVPAEVLARLLGVDGVNGADGADGRGGRHRRGGTAAFTGVRTAGASCGGALLVDTPDLDALAGAAESLAAQYAAPAPAPAELSALLGELTLRGVSVRVLHAGPDGDGAVAQLVAGPVARDVAAWAAGRQLAPGPLYGISFGLGLLAAVWFSEPATRAQIMAITVLLFSFVAGRAAAQLAATGRASPALDWLGAAAGMLTEFAIYAALAVSSGLAAATAGTSRTAALAGTANPVGLNGIFGDSLRNTLAVNWGGAGQVGVWRLAIAAMLLLAARRLAGICYESVARASGHPFPRPARRLLGQIITLPAGERIAVIAVTAVFFGPRLTFLVLLAWGAVAAAYAVAGQLASASKLAWPDGEPTQPNGEATPPDGEPTQPNGEATPPDGEPTRRDRTPARARGMLPAYRDDGPIAYRIGGVVRGQLPPLPPLLVGLLVTGDLAFLGLGNLPGVLILAPVAAMLLAALGARHPHDRRLDWLVPSLLLVGEGVFLTGLGFDRHVWLPVIFALLAAVITRHADLAYRARSGQGIPDDAFGLGWDGRMLVAGLAGWLGVVPYAYAVLGAWLWLLAGWDFLGAWLRPKT